MMKRTITALALAAVVVTPAMAAGFRQEGAKTPDPGFAYNETATSKAYRAPTSTGYGMMAAPSQQMAYQSYAYAPALDTTRINSPAFAIDPDPSVRQQLQIQSDLSDR